MAQRAFLKNCLFSAKVLNPLKTSYFSATKIHTASKLGKTFEPDYLDAYGYLPPKLPKFNIQIQGYDFSILESYQRYVHNLAENIGIDVSESWATPCTSWSANTFVEGGTKIKDTFKLHHYERNIQIENVNSTDLPILVDILQKTLPEGVSLSIHEHEEKHYEARFIPDPFIDGLKSELGDLEEKRLKAMEEKDAKEAAKKKVT